MKYNLHLIKFTKFKSTVQCILANAYSYLTTVTTKRLNISITQRFFLVPIFKKHWVGGVILLAFSWAQRGKSELISMGSQKIGQLDSLEREIGGEASPWNCVSILLLLLLSCFSRVRLCATPEKAAHQAPLSLGFSRQEHWSGLPFPSPFFNLSCTQNQWENVLKIPLPELNPQSFWFASSLMEPGFTGGSDGKKSASCNARDLGSVTGLGKSAGEGNGNPFQYSCLENPMDRETWQATVHGVTKSWTRVRHTHTHTHTRTGYLLKVPPGNSYDQSRLRDGGLKAVISEDGE